MKNSLACGLAFIAFITSCSSKSAKKDDAAAKPLETEPETPGGATDPTAGATPTTPVANNDSGGGAAGGGETPSVPAVPVAPTVSSTVPADLATSVRTNQSLTITFSSAMDPTTLNSTNIILSKVNGSTVVAPVSYNTGTFTVTLKPTNRLSANTNYQVSVTTSVKNAAGTSLASAKTMSFTTVSSGFTWVAGTNTLDDAGSFGTKGVSDPSNRPPALAAGAMWFDSNNSLHYMGGTSNLFDPLNTLWQYTGGNWTWLAGDSSTGAMVSYGTLGVSDPTNDPGGRFSSAGVDYRNHKAVMYSGLHGGMRSDFWTWDGSAWTWTGGLNSADDLPSYGMLGVPAPSSHPGARSSGSYAYDKDGNLYLFGGIIAGQDSNDLWKFDGTNWTWISGDNTLDEPGVWGVKGTPSASNKPSARRGSQMWIDASSNIWLWGGRGLDFAGNVDSLSDLWKFDGSNWTWVHGSKLGGEAANFGTLGVPSNSNTPGALSKVWPAASAIDSYGNFWMFGGGELNYAAYSDLWMWNGTQWTWMAGSDQQSAPGNFGTKGVKAPSNIPGARIYSDMKFDNNGDLWIFGGYGHDATSSVGVLNDLWMYTP